MSNTEKIVIINNIQATLEICIFLGAVNFTFSDTGVQLLQEDRSPRFISLYVKSNEVGNEVSCFTHITGQVPIVQYEFESVFARACIK
jgi:hypothetical protein